MKSSHSVVLLVAAADGAMSISMARRSPSPSGALSSRSGGELTVQGTKTHAQRRVTLDDQTWSFFGRSGSTRSSSAFAWVRQQMVTTSAWPGARVREPCLRLGISQAWRRLAKQAGVKLRLHDLRHLQGRCLLDAGEAVTTVAARLGHGDTSTTLKSTATSMPGA